MITPFVLLPLYAYPTDPSWTSVYTQIEANPSVPFTVIVNPSNGPGGNSPDSAFATGVSRLNAYNNTQVIGYVHVTAATRTQSDVTADIDAYAAWASYSAADAHLDGIFFDESPNDATSDAVSYMTDVTGHARSALAVNGVTPHITLNPGAAVSDSYYNLADIVVAFEDAYSVFSSANINLVQTSQRSKSAFILNSFTAASSEQGTVVSSLLTGDIPGSYITDSTSYNDVSSMLAGLVSAVGSGSAVAGDSSTSASATATATKASSSASSQASQTSKTAEPTNTETSTPTTFVTSVLPTSTETAGSVATPTTAQTAASTSTSGSTSTSTHSRHHRYRPTSTSTATTSAATDSASSSDDEECDKDE